MADPKNTASDPALLSPEAAQRIRESAEKEAEYAMAVLTNLMRDVDKTPAHIRAAAAKEVLDRALGRPVQQIKDDRVPPSNLDVSKLSVEELEHLHALYNKAKKT